MELTHKTMVSYLHILFHYPTLCSLTVSSESQVQERVAVDHTWGIPSKSWIPNSQRNGSNGAQMSIFHVWKAYTWLLKDKTSQVY